MALAREVSVLLPALTSLPIAAMITDINGVVRWANACFTVITGYSIAEIVGQNAGMLESESPKHMLQEILNHVLATGETWKGETLGWHKNREVHDIEWTITPIRNCSDVVTHALWTLQRIAERKHSYPAALEAYADFESVFRLLPDLACVASTDGIFQKVNSTWQEALGYTPEELLETPFVAFLHPDDTDPKLGSGQGMLQFVNRYRHKDGSYRWLEWRATPPIGSSIFLTARDVTERKRAEDTLRQSNETLAKEKRRYSSLFNSVSDAVFVYCLGEDGLPSHFTDVNEAACRYLGYTREELLRIGVYEVVAPELTLNFRAIMQRLAAEGQLLSEGLHVAKDGRRIPVDVNTRLFTLDGLPTVISCVRDITEAKKSEGTMKSLVTAIEQTSETVVITALDGTIQYCNPAFSKVTGYSKEEVIGQNPRVLKSGKHSKEFYNRMWATIMQGNVWTGRLTNKKKDGSFYQEEATISPIRDASGKLSGFVAVKRDVTEQLLLEDQLRQAQRLESIGRLAGGVAHDFNNLLTVINGYSAFLLKGLKASDPLRPYADEIQSAGDRAADLTQQLLAFSRKQIIEPRVLDLNTTIRESAPMLQRLIGEDIVLETHLDAALGQVLADPNQIHQVIMNLAVNARDAMPDGGTLDIKTTNVEIDDAIARSMSVSGTPGRYVLMAVTDTGHGIDEAIRKNIFEPFFTTKEVGKGTGLGLSTVYGIIRQNGGWIDVWSEVDTGTTFKMYFLRTDASPTPQRNRISAPTEGGNETILVVEDQEPVRSFAAAVLRRGGYQVIQASDGDEAISVAEQHSERIHVLLTDVVIPGINGKELSERLKVLHPNLKVIFTSGYTADVIAHRGVLNPGVAFLPKPFSPDALAAKVRAVLDSPTAPMVGS